MRASKKADRAMQQLAEMMLKHGIGQEVIEDAKETAPTDRLAISRQGEAVLLFLESPAKFTTKFCKREDCGEAFGTNYRHVAYCSDNCRAKEMSRIIGVKWDWMRATEEERWGGEPPLIIPPPAYRKIRQFVSFFVDTLPTQTQNQSPQQSSLRQEHQDIVHHLVEASEALGPDVAPEPHPQEVHKVRTSPQQLLPESPASQNTAEESLFDFE